MRVIRPARGCGMGLLLGLTLLLGCTKTAGVVTDVTPVAGGGLLVTKCDEIVYLNYQVIAIGQGNCRNELVSTPTPKPRRSRRAPQEAP